ncbi:hypothetical protein TKK_0016807 [Trichogramma kaykai]|uniref:Diphosphomevalonate decarboxylase n=1 Tax=Trichogramma kaykai TaxID=54128 RepID=A0ABD2W476_9HYME
MTIVTCIAPVNIAVIKYWGKRDESLILPINDSLSATLDTEHLCAKTTVMISPNFTEDRIWLNGSEESINNPRLQNCLKKIRQKSELPAEMNDWKVHICSQNNFPTAAGLASSAAGYACLAYALAKLFKVKGDISEIARSGSGSACRSVYGGFVKWLMGTDPSGCDSIAKQVVPSSHWSDMRILVLVVNDSKKKVSSSVGMQRTVKTSELLSQRATTIVPHRIVKMEQALHNKDFETFAELTMKDSNNMHAVTLDTYPPCTYMNDTSHNIVDFVHAYNAAKNVVKVAYTFDAGPNATLFLLEKDVAEFIGALNHYFPPAENSDIKYQKGIFVENVVPSESILKNIKFVEQPAGKLKYIIHTRVGDGPKQLENSKNHLLNEDGLPH